MIHLDLLRGYGVLHDDDPWPRTIAPPHWNFESSSSDGGTLCSGSSFSVTLLSSRPIIRFRAQHRTSVCRSDKRVVKWCTHNRCKISSSSTLRRSVCRIETPPPPEVDCLDRLNVKGN